MAHRGLLNVKDDRGSKHQHHLYDLVCQLYGSRNVIWEYVIPDLNLRIDILVKSLGIAIEYDGTQHSKFNEFFHKDEAGYVFAAKRDAKKEQWISEHGIKLIRLDGDCMNMDSVALKKKIDSVDYPASLYEGIEFKNSNEDILKTARKLRSDNWQKVKKGFHAK